MILDKLLQRLDIFEDQDTEFKAAEGGLPKSIWETISAFANTEGGYIVLGIKQHKDKFEITGIKQPETLVKSFWDTHNNPEKLSIALCAESDVKIITLDQCKLIILQIPRAHRTQRPVYINNNPVTGAYKRNYEGDYRCNKDEIQQMLRDASDKPQDIRILNNFDLNDLDSNTLKSFRQRFISREPDHPFLELDDKALLSKIGGWYYDREKNENGLTLAGLLMFGRERSILDALPYYHLDYREETSEDPEQRWIYRLTLDGKWEPNLYNFYYGVYNRLTQDLDLPFQLDGEAVRRGETHVHEALREALVNTLMHADHQSKCPIIITKRSDLFLFSNAGRFRFPIQRLYEGGMSDPRNPHLQKMFQMIGLAGKAWQGQGNLLQSFQYFRSRNGRK